MEGSEDGNDETCGKSPGKEKKEGRVVKTRKGGRQRGLQAGDSKAEGQDGHLKLRHAYLHHHHMRRRLSLFFCCPHEKCHSRFHSQGASPLPQLRSPSIATFTGNTDVALAAFFSSMRYAASFLSSKRASGKKNAHMM